MGVGDYITPAVTPAGQVCCLDLPSMTIRWKFPLPGTVLGAVSILPDGVVFAGSDGVVYRLDAQGRKLASQAVGSPILASLAIGHDHFYAVTNDGLLHCLSRQTLQPVWQHRLAADGHCVTSPILASSL